MDSGERPAGGGDPADVGESGPELVPRLEQWDHELVRAADPFDDAVVVIVDDNPANVMLLERILAADGVSKVHTVLDSRDAAERCLGLEPDLILLDLHMPHVDGFSVLETLTSSLAPDDYLPVIVLTADTNPATRERALGAGAKDFLTKPFDRVEVTQRARNVLRTGGLYRAIRREQDDLRRQVDDLRREQQQHEAEQDRQRELVTGALREGGPRMVFQPIVDIATHEVTAVEALARFDSHPQQTPDAWFAMAANVGLAAPLEVAAITNALPALDALPDQVCVSVNVSPATLVEEAFLDAMAHPSARRVIVELTEHDQIADYPAVLSSIETLRRSGTRIAVDDAGAGYAGLRQILRLHPDIIKLDTELTRHIDTDPVRRALTAALVSFARSTDATIIAEGIETAAELQTVRDLGVAWGQGYFLGRPQDDPRSAVTSVTETFVQSNVRSDRPRPV